MARAMLDDDEGVSIIEMLVAMSVLLVVLVATAGTLTQSLQLSTSNHRRVIASNLASQELDLLRTMEFSTLEAAITTPLAARSETLEGAEYTIRSSLSWATLEVDGNSCDAPDDGGPTHVRAHVEVSWANRGTAIPPVVTDTIIGPAVGEIDPNRGHLGVIVKNRADPAEPVAGKQVRLAHQSGAPVIWRDTDEYGCAFFAFLNPGEWNVSINESQPELWASRPVLPAPAGVSAGALQKVTIEYDLASTLVLRLAPDMGPHAGFPANAAVVGGLAATVEHLNPTLRDTQPWTPAGGVQTTRRVFATSGYSAWLGEGVGLGEACLPEGARSATVTAEAGESHILDVPAARLDIRTRRGNNNQANVTMTAQRVAACGVDAPLVLALGASSATGQRSVLLPYGRWRISGTGTGGTYGPVEVDLQPGVFSGRHVEVRR